VSKALSGWQARVVYSPEVSIGTPVTPAVLWNSTESDSLGFGEAPIDMMEAFTGARGALSRQLRTGVYEPGGELGAAPIYLDADSNHFLEFSYRFFQKVTRTPVGTGGLYNYTFSPIDTQPDGAAIKSLTVLKDTAMGTGKCQRFTGAIISAINYSWDFGGAIMQTPTLMALKGEDNATAPGPIAPPEAGYLQAPNMAVTFNGDTIHPVSWSIKLDSNVDGVTGPSTDAFRTFSFGQATGEVELKVWRDDDFYARYVAPYEAMEMGTLIITASVDTSYGEHVDDSPFTATWTVNTRAKARPELGLSRGEMTDTVKLDVVFDAYPTLVVSSERSAALS